MIPGSDLWLGWGLKQTCSSPRELTNGVSHSTYTHWGRVDFRLLVVGSQTASLTPSLSFDHNLCYICPNDSCKAIFDIYTLRPFQRYKKHLKARCFDPCNGALKFWESRKAPSSHFWECEFHPHTCLKVGLQQLLKWCTRITCHNHIREYELLSWLAELTYQNDFPKWRTKMICWINKPKWLVEMTYSCNIPKNLLICH